MKNFQKEENPDDVEGEEDAEAKELEKIIEDKHANYSKISRHYKLFEYLSKSDPGQVLRYVKPTKYPS